MIDTGAQVSIMNFPTYSQIREIQNVVLKRAPTVVRAADGLIIPFLGIADITFCLNVDGKHKFNHTFWIATENKSCKTNLIGMDCIRNH